MGHCHTREEQGSAEPVRGFDSGSSVPAPESVEKLPSGAPVSSSTAQGPAASQQAIAVRVALFALRFYKTYLSILMGGTCRFEPTCSRYAYEAVELFGVMRGSWLALKRLLRCQPLSRKFGFDPVPEAPDIHRHRAVHQEAHS